MRPILETIKSDKIIDENFEAIKGTLCGNVSLDNMSVRILEGITQDADLQNLVIHSGQTRPVGWFPLIGDVYIQEISDKYIDVRSTKPQVAYKILVLFGPAITDAALKEIGGPGYKNTDTITTETVTQEIELIEETVIQYKPIALRSYIHPNPCNPAAATPTTNYNRVIAGNENFYVLGSGQKVIFRINKTTHTVDWLSFNVGTGYLTTMKEHGAYIFVTARSTVTGKVMVYQVDPSTFTIINTWTGSTAYTGSTDLHITDNYIYYIQKANNSTSSTAYRINITTSALDAIALTPYSGGVTKTYTLGGITASPSDGVTNGSLWVVVDNNFKASAEVIRIEIEHAVTHAPLFAVTDTISSTDAFAAGNILYHNGEIYVPVINNSTHRNKGGQTNYLGGIIKINIHTPYNSTIIPISIAPDIYFYDTIIESDNYLYMVQPIIGTNAYSGTRIFRYNTVDSVVDVFFIPLPISGAGGIALDSFAFKDSDDTLLFLQNTGTNLPASFIYATVDFTNYDNDA